MTKNQASGGERVKIALSQVRRHSIAEKALGADGRWRGCPGPCCGPGLPSRLTVADNGQDRQLMICVQAETQLWNGTQSDLPLPHWANGVFQNLIVLKYDSGASAW